MERERKRRRRGIKEYRGTEEQSKEVNWDGGGKRLRREKKTSREKQGKETREES